ncbi:unnamed protein product [Didymodactylos carnosus]|uniref:Uncharacterized protein n=1 Tax=Didymodactylos carnosus TaxID=1234261 RepID=A0A8S2GJV3_9BILA|nr:unnamed protein product [Didymodactylos carnosus]CAF3527180.1 unnamed protein product [Didymodactylos carnosus]
MKILNERIIFYLKTDNYDQCYFEFWSVIADFDYNIDLTDTLNYFKKLFCELIEEHLRFYGTNIFVNVSLENEHWSGMNLIINSDVINFVTDEPNTKIKVDLTGKKGADGANGKGGSHGKRCVEDRLDGVPGENGQVGGNIYFIVNKYFKGQENIEKLITSGDEGSNGGNGGRGGNDHDEKNGDPGPKDHGLGFLFSGYDLKEGEPGVPGGDGGNRGDANLGGFGGHAGEVHIEDNSPLVDKIESIDKSNRSAEHGKPGEGGKGGVGGYDGVDTLYYKRHKFAPIETCEGYILTVFHKAHWFSFDIEVIYHDKHKKRDGISRAQGKTADMQIDSGKTRQKCENKEKSNEKQIKN